MQHQTLVATLAEVEAKTFGKTLGNVKAEAWSARFLTRYKRLWLTQMRTHLHV